MQTPLTMCSPGPQACRTLKNMSVGAYSGARGIARADDTKTKANTAMIHLVMASLPLMTAHPSFITRRVLPSPSVDLDQWSGPVIERRLLKWRCRPQVRVS